MGGGRGSSSETIQSPKCRSEGGREGEAALCVAIMAVGIWCNLAAYMYSLYVYTYIIYVALG